MTAIKNTDTDTVDTVKAPPKGGDLSNRTLHRTLHVPPNRTVPYTYRINRILRRGGNLNHPLEG